MLLWKCDSYFAILFKTKGAIVWRAGKKRLVWRGKGREQESAESGVTSWNRPECSPRWSWEG